MHIKYACKHLTGNPVIIRLTMFIVHYPLGLCLSFIEVSCWKQFTVWIRNKEPIEEELVIVQLWITIRMNSHMYEEFKTAPRWTTSVFDSEWIEIDATRTARNNNNSSIDEFSCLDPNCIQSKWELAYRAMDNGCHNIRYYTAYIRFFMIELKFKFNFVRKLSKSKTIVLLFFFLFNECN